MEEMIKENGCKKYFTCDTITIGDIAMFMQVWKMSLNPKMRKFCTDRTSAKLNEFPNVRKWHDECDNTLKHLYHMVKKTDRDW